MTEEEKKLRDELIELKIKYKKLKQRYEKVFNTISLIALIFTILYPIFISFNSELDLITKIINYLLSIGSIYFLYTIWENHKKV